MKRFAVAIGVIAAMLLVSVVSATVTLQAVKVVDIKSNGTAVGYFSRPAARYWNFTGAGGNATLASDTLTIGTHYAPYDPDMGSTESKSVQIGSTAAKPTCASGTRGLVYTVQNDAADGGTKDITYQCCKFGASTYTWVSPTCL